MRMLVLGTGKMAKAIAYDFSRQKDVTKIGVAGRKSSSSKSILKFIKSKKAKGEVINLKDVRSIVTLMKSYDVAVSAVPYLYNYMLAQAAVKAKCHFVDLGGNNVIVKQEFSLSKEAKKNNVTIVPDSGLAPGLVSNLTALGLEEFGSDKVQSVKLRVGGLPQHPKRDLEYMIVFSVKGLINEYIEPVKVIENFKIKTIKPMEPTEKIFFKGYGNLEAFPTSGGISTMSSSFKGKIKSLNYKTIRYPGHAAKIRTLMQLGFTSSEIVKELGISPRAVLEHQLKKLYTLKDKDLVLLKVTLESRKRSISYTLVDKETKGLTAMMRCTGFPAATIALMIARGDITKRGTLKHEFDVPPSILYRELLKKGLNIVRSSKKLSS
jgi:lysine 6-dehydrogenase